MSQRTLINRRTFMSTVAGAALAMPAIHRVRAQATTLRLHQFLPPVATLPAQVLRPWAERLSASTDGEIDIQHFDAMALGGRPPELMDQARDGVADMTMTLVGYTPGRFPRTEVFELPFMMTDPRATALAFSQMVEQDLQNNEYRDVKVLGAWVHGPGVIHTADGVNRLEDMTGKTMRGPTRVINDLIAELGATPVGMPLPGIPEALSKGVINGTVIPWEVTPSIRLSELVTNHTEFGGNEALYTATIVLVMNRARYEALPDDIRAALDAESGDNLAAFAAEVMEAADAPGRAIAEAAGNTIVELDEAEVARWKEASQPVVERWIADMAERDIDGQALIDRARALIAENTAT
jgi:TRAP-type C4-dicarboxylate transport system substrate-binding protein